MILEAASAALTRLFSPEFRAVFFKSLALTLLLLAGAWFGLKELFDWLALPWIDALLPGFPSWAGWLALVAAIVVGIGLALGLAHYAVGTGEAEAMAVELAGRIADNARLVNNVIIQAISRIGDMSRADGLYTESLCAALTQTSDDAAEGLSAFLEKRQPRFG